MTDRHALSDAYWRQGMAAVKVDFRALEERLIEQYRGAHPGRAFEFVRLDTADRIGDMADTPTYERITAEDVQVGDRIARTRAGEFLRVTAITEGPVARRFLLKRDAPYTYTFEFSGGEREVTLEPGSGGSIRPRRTAKLWRQVQS